MLHYIKCLNKKLDELEQKVVNASQKVIEYGAYQKITKYVNVTLKESVTLKNVAIYNKFTEANDFLGVNVNCTIKIIFDNNAELLMNDCKLSCNVILFNNNNNPLIMQEVYNNDNMLLFFKFNDDRLIMCIDDKRIIKAFSTINSMSTIAENLLIEYVNATPIKEIMMY